MTLCPNCRTIQKAGTNCSICKCPVMPAGAPEAEGVAEVNAAAVGVRVV
jgi:hypothetical protein